MRQIALTTILLSIGINSIFSQSYEVGYYTGIGISEKNIDRRSEWNEYETHSTCFTQELRFNYILRANKNAKLFIGSGLNFSNNKFHQTIKSFEYQYNIQDVHFSQKHISTPIRIGVDKELIRQNSIGVQYELQYNISTYKEERIAGTETAIFGSLNYTYTLTHRPKNFLSNTLTMYLRTKIANKLNLHTSLGYRFTPRTGEFDFITHQVQTLTDQDTGHQTHLSSRYGFENEEIRHNLVVVKIGLTTMF